MGAMLADLYLRISDDKEGLELGVDRQETDCRALAASLGATVRKVWKDNDVGASTLSRKPRPDYRAMIDAVRSGETDMILTYSNSRLTRRPLELEEWIGLHAETGIQIHTVVSGSDDLGTADGRMVARVKASVDAAEAERTGERVARHHKQAQQQGRPAGGPRPFGFKPDRISHDPIESVAIQKAVAHILRGGTTGDIVREWNAKGITTTKGNKWTTSTVMQTLKNPRLKGQRAHWVYEKGKRGHWEPVLDAAGNEVKARWEAIVTPKDFDQLQEWFTKRAMKHSRGERPSRRHLLTPFLRCGNCGGSMRAVKSATVKGGWTYVCQSVTHGGCGSVGRAAYRVDKIVIAAVLRGLDAVLTGVQPDPVSVYPDEDLRRLDGLLADALKAWKLGDLPSGDYFTLRRELTEERKRLQVDALEAQKKSERATIQVDAPARWESATLSEKQAILETMITAIVIDPLPRHDDGRKIIGWNPELVRIVWKHTQEVE